jgi:riboflavin synthase
MFTGIIETLGQVEAVTDMGSGKSFRVSSALASELKIDQSISHNGVCLTVEEIFGNEYQVTAIRETLLKTNLDGWKAGTLVNIERCMQMNGRLDGHIVQGHVDATGICIGKQEAKGSQEFRFRYPKEFLALVIEKGSICLNGISLTVFGVAGNEFSVAIIPYTYEHTNIKTLNEGDTVNLEFDVIGKYVQRIMEISK